MPRTKAQIRTMLDQIILKMEEAASCLEHKGRHEDAGTVDEAAMLVEDLRKGRYASAREKREEEQRLRDITSGKIKLIRIDGLGDSWEFLNRLYALEDPRELNEKSLR